MDGAHILVVEDEQDIQQLVEYSLLKDGYRVSCAATGEEALRLARAGRPDLVILDLMLPGIDGLEVCRALRRNRESEKIAIVMLTAKGEEADIVAGLELGADDYITKPFSPKVLTARVHAVLRRRKSPPVKKDAVIRVHDLVINPGRHEVLHGNERIDLTHMEFRLLQLLASRPGWVFTRDQIVNSVRGENYPVTDRAVDVQIVGLRRKLGSAGKYIETVRGVGYRLGD